MELYHVAQTLHALIAGIMLGMLIVFPWILYKIRQTQLTERKVLKYCMNTGIAICYSYIIIFLGSAILDMLVLNPK